MAIVDYKILDDGSIRSHTPRFRPGVHHERMHDFFTAMHKLLGGQMTATAHRHDEEVLNTDSETVDETDQILEQE